MTFLQYQYYTIYKKHKDTGIPWGVLDLEPSLKYKTIPLFYEIILSKLYPAAVIIADYPDTIHEGVIFGKVNTLSVNAGIDYSLILYDEKIQHIMVAGFKLINRYLDKGKHGNIIKFIISNLPLYYTREISMSQIYSIDEDDIDVCDFTDDKSEDEYLYILPGSPAEYADFITGTNTAEYARKYSFYNRAHIYRIIRKLPSLPAKM